MNEYKPEDLERRAAILDAAFIHDAANMLRAGAQAMRDVEAAQERVKELDVALNLLIDNSTYETPSGNINCRYCDYNMDHEGTFKNMHSKTCEINKARAALQVKP